MLRITSMNHRSTETLKLEGKLVEPWVTELLQTCSQLLERGLELRLDLAAVSFVDPAGTQALRGLIRRGVTIGPCSGFVAELLKQDEAS
jgi:ABC-type transporter Mla MlaB component